MSKGEHDISALVIKFWGVDWQPKHIAYGLFEATNISGQTLARNLIEILNTYELKKKIVVYVKDEGFNFNIMIIILKLVLNFNVLGLEDKFQRTCIWSCIF
jgi:hypothetical protein